MQLPSFVRAFLIELSLAWQERVPLRHWHALRTPQRFKLIFFFGTWSSRAHQMHLKYESICFAGTKFAKSRTLKNQNKEWHRLALN